MADEIENIHNQHPMRLLPKDSPSSCRQRDRESKLDRDVAGTRVVVLIHIIVNPGAGVGKNSTRAWQYLLTRCVNVEGAALRCAPACAITVEIAVKQFVPNERRSDSGHIAAQSYALDVRLSVLKRQATVSPWRNGTQTR